MDKKENEATKTIDIIKDGISISTYPVSDKLDSVSDRVDSIDKYMNNYIEAESIYKNAILSYIESINLKHNYDVKNILENINDCKFELYNNINSGDNKIYRRINSHIDWFLSKYRKLKIAIAINTILLVINFITFLFFLFT